MSARWVHEDLLAHLLAIADDELELTSTQADFAVKAAMWIFLSVDDAGLRLSLDTIASGIREEIDFLVEAADGYVAAKLDDVP